MILIIAGSQPAQLRNKQVHACFPICIHCIHYCLDSCYFSNQTEPAWKFKIVLKTVTKVLPGIIPKDGKDAVVRDVDQVQLYKPVFLVPTGQYRNDLALLHMTRAVPFDDYVSPICLPPANYMYNATGTTNCYSTGWGFIKPEKSKCLNYVYNFSDASQQLSYIILS